MRKLTTAPSFTEQGVLVPAGTLIEVENFVPADKEGKNDDANFQDVPSNYAPPPPVVVAAIGPTGPQPTQPQVIPPGAMQTLGGYSDAQGNRLIAEGSAEAIQVEEGGPSTNATGNTGGASEKPAEPGPLDQSVADLTKHLDGMSNVDDVQALRDQEVAGKSRKGALDAIDARLETLKPTALS